MLLLFKFNFKNNRASNKSILVSVLKSLIIKFNYENDLSDWAEQIFIYKNFLLNYDKLGRLFYYETIFQKYNVSINPFFKIGIFYYNLN